MVDCPRKIVGEQVPLNPPSHFGKKLLVMVESPYLVGGFNP